MLFRRLNHFLTKRYLEMSTYTQKLNPITGKSDWEVQSEDYDYHQEVARSSFADMLHDTERNQKYEEALKIAIKKLHLMGKKANVLDIGTGTGLLSMMAVRNGADSVTACEAFKPMSVCAVDTIKLNGFEDKIKVIPKRSTDLTVGEHMDLNQRANILVTEVFDTELIGEGALSTFKHAHKELLEIDCIVIPQSATIYAQIVESPFVQSWNKLKNIHGNSGELLIKVPDSIKNCPGAAAVHDLQMSQLPVHLINRIVSPQPVLRFDWSGKTPFIFERSTISTFKAELDGKAQIVFMWWDLIMDIDSQIILSCAPVWAHPNSMSGAVLKLPWRDHWMQAIYYLPKEIDVKTGEEINLISCHDEFSLWFNLCKDLKITNEDYLRPICECGVHVAFSRTRIGQLNDGTRNKKFVSVLEENVKDSSVVLILSHGCYAGLVAAKLGARKVYCLENNLLLRRILKDYVQCNNLDNMIIIENVEHVEKMKELQDVTIVFSEPYFTSSILPWDNLLLTYLLKDMKHILPNNITIFPKKAVIKGMAVEFSDLYKIRASLGKCQGFLMKCFDQLIEVNNGEHSILMILIRKNYVK